MINAGPDGALARLLTSHAPAHLRPWHRFGWVLDERLAGVVRAAREPAIGAIRMAWWREALAQDDRSKGRGEPLVEAWRAGLADPVRAAAIDRLIDGWLVLLAEETPDPAALLDFGRGRGGGLFALLAGRGGQEQPEAVEMAGTLWALWDLAGHSADPQLARSAIDQAAALGALVLPAGRALKPLRLAAQVALADMRPRRVPSGGFSPRHYAALLRHALLG